MMRNFSLVPICRYKVVNVNFHSRTIESFGHEAEKARMGLAHMKKINASIDDVWRKYTSVPKLFSKVWDKFLPVLKSDGIRCSLLFGRPKVENEADFFDIFRQQEVGASRLAGWMDLYIYIYIYTPVCLHSLCNRR